MQYRLGLDLGVRSLGWAAIAIEDEKDTRLLDLGVRLFEAGVEGIPEEGREESRGAVRRAARLARRQTRRRKQRARSLYFALVEAGLLPAVTHGPGQPLALQIQGAINGLDKELRNKYATESGVNQLPYLLRARALDHPLEPHELGRVLYHLGQRRGFLSNRKAKVKTADQKEAGVVYEGIRHLEVDLANYRTLGEFLSKLDPHQQRIRKRYTHRKMYESEFAAIWQSQSAHHPALTTGLRDRVSAILFSQRPLKGADDLVGKCEFEPGQKRAPVWSLEFQHFRLLQAVVHLRIQEPNGVQHSLTPQQRDLLVTKLQTVRELTFKAAKKLLGMSADWKFTIEEGGETKFKGNAVSAQFSSILRELWENLSPEARILLLEKVAEADTDEGVTAVLAARGLSPESARATAERIALPPGYASLSIKAIRKLLPLMEQGLSVQEARQKAGYEIVKSVPVHELLPPLQDTEIDIRNPAVTRSLTELRKVVNGVVRKYGKPVAIHIELARELKKNRESRARDSKRMRDREAVREKMRIRINAEIGIPLDQIKRSEIELGLLYDECGGHCPYTGESLGTFASLFRGSSVAQVEHIIPRSLSLDDSFENLTLATVTANREKGNCTPSEAYGQQEQRWGEIVERVQAFKGEYARRKLARFQLQAAGKAECLADFTERHLNDTRYASRVAASYLALLYGGEIVDGKQKILKATGQITAELRGLWNLNQILSGDSWKSREDHRHHAIDAAVLAVVSQKWVTVLSSAAERAWQEHKRRYASVPPPWEGFKEDVARAISGLRVSIRPDRRVTGALHKETFYTAPTTNVRGGDVVRTRKPVDSLSIADVEFIADPCIREIVRASLERVGGKAEKLRDNWPLLPNRKGPLVPIKSVRIELNRAVQSVGTRFRQRYAEGSETHHVAIFEVSNGRRRVWDGEVVSMSEALDRVRRKLPVVDRNETAERGFLFSLCKKDTLTLEDPNGKYTGLWTVRKIRSNKQIILSRATDARVKPDEYAPRISGLQKLNAKKAIVLPGGDIHQCHD